MTKLKWTIPILVLIELNTYSQNSILKVETNINKYFIDTIEYNQVDLTLENLTKDTYVLWIDNKNHDSLTAINRINQYFNTPKGDFALSSLLYEELSNELPTQIYLTFYKILWTNEKFVISLLFKGSIENKIDQISNLKNQIVIIRSNESTRLPLIEDLKRYDYKGNSIILTEEMIKK